MDKATFIRTLTEERCDDFRLRLAMKTEGELKVTRIAPLDEDDVDLLVEFEGTPTNAKWASTKPTRCASSSRRN